MPTPTRCTSGSPTTPSASGRHRPAESYLRIDAIVDAARATGADAVHPGYGFLAERAAFARAVTDAGLVFVGPTRGHDRGPRRQARALAGWPGRSAVETVPGTLEPRPSSARRVARDRRRGRADRLPAAGQGGGRRRRARDAARRARRGPARGAERCGRRRRRRPSATARSISSGRSGRRATSRSSCWATQAGQVVALGERDCSIQRRHQKLVEEAPAPGLDGRRAPGASTRWPSGSASAAGLTQRGDRRVPARPGRPTLLPRGQHAAPGRARRDRAGDRPRPRPGAVRLAAGRAAVRGRARAAATLATEPARHAIEVRITAEDPARAFAPTPGRIRRWVDAGRAGRPGRHRARRRGPGPARVRQPDRQDHGPSAATGHAAIAGLRRALDEIEVGGIQTTLPFHRFVASHPAFAPGRAVHRLGRGEHWDGPAERDRRRPPRPLAAGRRPPPRDAATGPACGRRVRARSEPGPGDDRLGARPAASEAIDRWPE